MTEHVPQTWLLWEQLISPCCQAGLCSVVSFLASSGPYCCSCQGQSCFYCLMLRRLPCFQSLLRSSADGCHHCASSMETDPVLLDLRWTGLKCSHVASSSCGSARKCYRRAALKLTLGNRRSFQRHRMYIRLGCEIRHLGPSESELLLNTLQIAQ